MSKMPSITFLGHPVYFSPINPCSSLESHFKTKHGITKRQIIQPQTQVAQNQVQQNQIPPQNQIQQNKIPMMQVINNQNGIQHIQMPLLPAVTTTTDDIIINSIINECNAMYNSVYFVKINKLVSRTPNNVPNYGHKYTKRGIISDTKEATAEAACGMCFESNHVIIQQILSTFRS